MDIGIIYVKEKHPVSKNNIHDSVFIPNSVKLGTNITIEEGVIIGEYNLIGDNVFIGKNTELKNFIELRDNTHIGNNCYIDSRVSTSGNCKIRNNVTLRYDSIIARGCDIGDNTYICPRVMTNNLDTGKNQIGGAKIGKNCFIGTNSVLHHGIVIGNDSITGAMSFVTKNIPDKEIWIGSPARFFKKK